jgi:HEAT repeat protein
MTSRVLLLPSVFAAVVLMLAVAAAPRSAAAQTAATASLAKGWAALAAGNPAEAERAADALLKSSPRNHDAVALKIAARSATRTASGAGGALDAYETWAAGVRRDDVFLLEEVARGFLAAHAASKDPRVRSRALAVLAAAGDQEALKLLAASPAGEGASAVSDAALARLGQAPAVQRLVSRVKDGGARDVSDAIDALVDANVKGAGPVVASALDPSRPLPTRMAAARALGIIGDPSVVTPLKAALKDPDPPVRLLAAASLARLGDPAGDELVRKFENSPVGDFRLLLVEASAPNNPSGAWVGVATGVLQDADPMVRLRAAELLLAHAAEPGAARDVFAQAITDPNPAMRDLALRRLEHLPAPALERDLPALKRLLRDASPLAQVEAAAGILRVSGAIE